MQIWAGKVLNFSLQSSKLFACKTHLRVNVVYFIGSPHFLFFWDTLLDIYGCSPSTMSKQEKFRQKKYGIDRCMPDSRGEKAMVRHWFLSCPIV